MVSNSMAIKTVFGAVVIGLVGGMATRNGDSPPAVATARQVDTQWRPTRNSIGDQTPMSAAELDGQQPASAGRESVNVQRSNQTVGAGNSWSYRNCREARAAGAAPLYRGQPGYGAHMDGDNDGIACEPYHPR